MLFYYPRTLPCTLIFKICNGLPVPMWYVHLGGVVLFISVLEIKPGTSHIKGQYFTTELHPQLKKISS